MIKIKRMMYSVALLMLIGITGARAQVSIGTQEDPNPKSILDLSKISAKNLGLMLPQVPLANVKVWQLNGDTPVEGTLIYNINDNLYGQNYDNALGVFVWYDGEWHGLKKNEYGVTYATDFKIAPLSAKLDDVDDTQSFTLTNWSPTFPTAATYQGVTWSVVEGNDNVELENISTQSVTVKALVDDGSAMLRATSVDGHVVKEVPISIGCGAPVTGISTTTYQTGYFGVAGCWMTENLAETEYADGTTINTVAINDLGTDNTVAYISTPGAGAGTMTVEDAQDSDYEFSNGGVGKPGLLYSWVAATRDASSEAFFTTGAPQKPNRRVQGACPTGWHVPNDYEWNLLEKEIYEHPSAYSSQTTAGTWQDSYETGTSYRPSVGNTDKTYWGHQMKSSQQVTSTVPDGVSNAATANGFNGLLVGEASNSWVNYGTYAVFWSSSANTTSNGWRRSLYSGNSGAGRGYAIKYNRFSLRCKKD
jgi:uncharacterized protein (TIGR02145 family)